MGSSKNEWERVFKLLGSALKMVTEGSRSPRELADHLQIFVFGSRVEPVGDMIVRHVKDIDRTLTPQQVLDATGRKQYTNPNVVANMPREGRTEDDLFYFPLKRFTSPQKVAEALELRGLKPDPYAQAKDNADDSSFADKHPNGCQWKDADGNQCYASFYRWFVERSVDVYCYGDGWYGSWWVAGVRK